jgi:hypothetical protein
MRVVDLVVAAVREVGKTPPDGQADEGAENGEGSSEDDPVAVHGWGP